MSLDQRLSRAARQMADGVVPPEVDLGAVRNRARASQRRTAGLAAAAAVAAVVAVGAALANDRPDSAPEPVVPVPTPTATTEVEPLWSPDTVSTEEIVRAGDAQLTIAGIATGDPDRRLAVWTSGGDAGITLTTDGYRTTTYAPILGFTIGEYAARSIRDDLFLVTDTQNAEWLVGVDGTVRPVTREPGEVQANDDRLWFRCGTEGWRETWCALDPDAAKAYVWPEVWEGSAVPPVRGAQPWGANPEPRAVGNTGQLEAWWGAGSDRKVRTLAAAQFGDYVLGCPAGLMALWSVHAGGARVDLHTSRDQGATWQTTSYGASTANQWWKVRCAPDGSFLAVDSEQGVVVWRAEPGGDAFTQVYDAPGTPDSIGVADVWTDEGRVFATGRGVFAFSDDSGRTWTEVRKWR